MTLLAVRQARGGPWDWSRDLREQDGFEAHAAFMDGLVADGFVVLGGPLEGDREVLLIVEAESDDAAWTRFADDPWIRDGKLRIASVDEWHALLRGSTMDR
jgi:uncharacterized protein YciI